MPTINMPYKITYANMLMCITSSNEENKLFMQIIHGYKRLSTFCLVSISFSNFCILSFAYIYSRMIDIELHTQEVLLCKYG